MNEEDIQFEEDIAYYKLIEYLWMVHMWMKTPT